MEDKLEEIVLELREHLADVTKAIEESSPSGAIKKLDQIEHMLLGYKVSIQGLEKRVTDLENR